MGEEEPLPEGEDDEMEEDAEPAAAGDREENR
jgi:hypothetical protein